MKKKNYKNTKQDKYKIIRHCIYLLCMFFIGILLITNLFPGAEAMPIPSSNKNQQLLFCNKDFPDNLNTFSYDAIKDWLFDDTSLLCRIFGREKSCLSSVHEEGDLDKIKAMVHYFNASGSISHGEFVSDRKKLNFFPWIEKNPKALQHFCLNPALEIRLSINPPLSSKTIFYSRRLIPSIKTICSSKLRALYPKEAIQYCTSAILSGINNITKKI